MLVAVIAACSSGAGTGDVPKATVVKEQGDRVLVPRLSPDGSQLAYWQPADTGSLFTLVIAKSDLTEPKVTTTTASSVPTNMLWSPDGARLAIDVGQAVQLFELKSGTSRAFPASSGYSTIVDWAPSGEALTILETVSGGKVRGAIFNLATGERRVAVPTESRPHFGFLLPDGQRFVYSVFDGSKSTIWITDSTRTKSRPLTTEGFEGWSTAYPMPLLTGVSPDGKDLLYVSWRTGRNDLWVVALDGGSPPRQLTKDVRDDDGALWSKDGRAVVYRSNSGGQIDLWSIPSTGGVPTRLTDTPQEDAAILGWVGTGEHATLLYTDQDRLSGVVARDLASGTERILIADSLRVRSLEQVSPDGSMVSAILTRGGADELVVSEVRSGTMRSLFRGTGRISSVSWAPDGKTLVIGSDHAGSPDIWTVRVADGKMTRITDWPGAEQVAQYSDDGRSIIFDADRDSKLRDLWKVDAAGGTPTRITRLGTILELNTIGANGQTLVAALRKSDGAIAPHRLLPDGNLAPIWTGSGSVLNWRVPVGDSLLVMVEERGRRSTRLIPLSGGTGREIYAGNVLGAYPSHGGRKYLVSVQNGATADLGLLDVDTRALTLLTKTPLASEMFGEFGADDQTVILRRQRLLSRYLTVRTSATP